MRTLIAPALLLTVLSALPAQALDNVAARGVMARAVDGFIKPGYADFHAKATALAEATAGLCAVPTETQLKRVDALFSETAASWARIWLMIR